MIRILADHNIEGQAVLLWGTLTAAGWLDMVPIRLVMLTDVGLPPTCDDRTLWRFVQANQMILFTDNRSRKDQDSLEQTIREELTTLSLPVLTVGNVRRLNEPAYRTACAERIIEIVIDIDAYRGVGRLFIP